MRMSGEIAIVTGSTSGLGKEIARMFAAEGAQVVVTGRNQERGDAWAKEIREQGGDAHFVSADLSDLGQCGALVEATVDRFGGLTVLVNNHVAATGDGKLGDVGLEEWETKVRVNLTAPAWLMKAAIPHMQAAGHGAIINISSRAAERGTPNLAAYAASKGGLNAVTRSVAIDYAKDGIRCNSVTPGYILHEVRDADIDPAKLARVSGQHLTRLISAADVAHCCVWLASKEGEVITGLDIPVSGGSTTARALTLG
jgi:NAD(P)-dependent dehydrogenase (short-subunit alcohol dehydrogenase family)